MQKVVGSNPISRLPVDDQQVLNHIDELVQEEERLLHAHESDGLSPEEHAKLEQVRVQLDQTWDLLRQRRSLRQYGENPDEASPRATSTVEDYLQ